MINLKIISGVDSSEHPDKHNRPKRRTKSQQSQDEKPYLPSKINLRTVITLIISVGP